MKTVFKIFFAASLFLFVPSAHAAGEITVLEPVGSGWSSVDSAAVEITESGSYDAIFEWGTETGVYPNNVSFLTEGGTCSYCGFSLGTSLDAGEYYARARLRDSEANTLFTSEEVWFEVSGGGDVLTIKYPQDHAIIPDFELWSLYSDTKEASGDYVNFFLVHYGVDPDNLHYYEEAFFYDLTGGTIFISKTTPLNSGQFYYAQAELYTCLAWGENLACLDDPVLIATSEMVSFDINNSLGVSEDEPCDTGDALGDIICTLFRPSQTVLTMFTDLWLNVEDKVPFGYFKLIKDSVDQIFEGDAAFEIPEFSLFDTIRGIIQIALWVLMAFWVVKRISTVDV